MLIQKSASVLASIFLIFFYVTTIHSTPSLGSESPVVDQGTIETLKKNIGDYLIELEHGGSPQMHLMQIFSASKQIVTGTLYTVEALIATPYGNKKCNIRVLEKPWIDFCKVSLTCENGAYYEVTFNPNQDNKPNLPITNYSPTSAFHSQVEEQKPQIAPFEPQQISDFETPATKPAVPQFDFKPQVPTQFAQNNYAQPGNLAPVPQKFEFKPQVPSPFTTNNAKAQSQSSFATTSAFNTPPAPTKFEFKPQAPSQFAANNYARPSSQSNVAFTSAYKAPPTTRAPSKFELKPQNITPAPQKLTPAPQEFDFRPTTQTNQQSPFDFKPRPVPNASASLPSDGIVPPPSQQQFITNNPSAQPARVIPAPAPSPARPPAPAPPRVPVRPIAPAPSRTPSRPPQRAPERASVRPPTPAPQRTPVRPITPAPAPSPPRPSAPAPTPLPARASVRPPAPARQPATAPARAPIRPSAPAPERPSPARAPIRPPAPARTPIRPFAPPPAPARPSPPAPAPARPSPARPLPSAPAPAPAQAFAPAPAPAPARPSPPAPAPARPSLPARPLPSAPAPAPARSPAPVPAPVRPSPPPPPPPARSPAPLPAPVRPPPPPARSPAPVPAPVRPPPPPPPPPPARSPAPVPAPVRPPPPPPPPAPAPAPARSPPAPAPAPTSAAELNVLPINQLPQGEALNTYLDGLFREFMSAYDREYINVPLEMEHRLDIFKENFNEMMEYVRGDSTAEYSVTQFSDLSQSEYQRLLGFDTASFSASDAEIVSSESLGNITDLPEKYDQRDEKLVTRVKHQGDCGACWAFLTTAVIEGLCAKRTKKLQEFSEQSLIDCDKTNFGCKGGVPPKAYKHISKRGGLELESVYPYTYGNGGNSSCHFDKKTVQAKVDGGLQFKKGDEENMAKWLYKNGPIAVGINSAPLKYYKRGIMDPSPSVCPTNKIDHGLTLIGFGVEVNKATGEKIKYWIAKNSWGTTFGEDGYVRIIRGKNACGLALWASSAKLTNVEKNCMLSSA